MSSNELSVTIWAPNRPLDLATALTPLEIAQHARALSERDIKSIVSAFESGSYEMVATFVWTRAITGLKKQIASLGMEFVGEMLRRPDIHDNSDPKTSISEHDAITLAEDLGMVTSTEAMRLKHALELVSHFSDPENAVQDQMNPEEAIGVFRACVVSILGNPHIEPPIQFAQLRASLENESLSPADPRVNMVAESPYFVQRTTLSVLLSLLKSAKGAQLEHAVGNTNVFLPRIWDHLRKPEKWQVGQIYAEVHTAGNQSAAVGLRNALTTVRGFDFVPENLRSDTFSLAAHKVMQAHFAFNNFYTERAPMEELALLGTTIPKPAFPVCLTAILCVYLGNSYGTAHAAQGPAVGMLTALRQEQWEYYLNECLRTDNTILDKLDASKPASRWVELCQQFGLHQMKLQLAEVQNLVAAGSEGAVQQARKRFRQLK